MKNKGKLILLLIISILFFFGCKQNPNNAAPDNSPSDNTTDDAGSSDNTSTDETGDKTSSDTTEETPVSYANYKKLTVYPEASVDDLYDTLSWLIYNQKNAGHPILVKVNDEFYPVTGLGMSPTAFTVENEILTDRFFAQTEDSVFFIGIALKKNKVDYSIEYYLSEKSRNGTALPNVYYLYIY